MTALRNVKHEKYCQCRLVGQSQFEASIKAYPHRKGWKPESVAREAKRLEQRSDVRARIVELQEETARTAVMTAEDVISEISRIASLPPGKCDSAKLRALDMLARIHGMYKTHQQQQAPKIIIGKDMVLPDNNPDLS